MAKNLKNLLRGILSNLSEIDVEAQKFYSLIDINSSYGVNLDVIGQIVGEARLVSETDVDYRARLEKRIQLINGWSDRELIIQSALYNSTATSIKLG